MGPWPSDETRLRAVLLRICAEGALVMENRRRPGDAPSRGARVRITARLRPILDALVTEGVLERHEAGALTVYIAWPEL